MGWTAPKTWTATTLTTTDMNTHVRDNLEALDTAQKISYTTKTSDTSFGTSATTVTSFSHTFDSGTVYEVIASWWGITPTSTSAYGYTFVIDVAGTNEMSHKQKSDGTTEVQCGGTVACVVSGYSGSQTVKLEVLATSGSGHTVEGDAAAPVYLRIRPVDVV